MKGFFAAFGILAWVAWVAAMAGSGIVALAPITFTDVTAQAGIKFVHNSGRAGKKFLGVRAGHHRQAAPAQPGE